MNNLEFSSPEEIQRLLGERLKRLRLQKNVDQATAADKAGVSLRTLRNLETGDGSTVESLIRVLKALGATSGIDAIAPEPTLSPLAMMMAQKKAPKRVRRSRKARTP